MEDITVALTNLLVSAPAETLNAVGRGFSVQEEGGAQDGYHGRQAAAEHAQEGGRQHHPGHRGGQHLQGRPRHPVPQPQRLILFGGMSCVL